MTKLGTTVLLLAVFVGKNDAQWNTNCADGRQAIVHLFEWRWDDVAAECERFLAPKGYCGVQVSPPSESKIVFDEYEQRPWFERYQPVSYRTYSRSGDETAFNSMVRRCNTVGVRIYVDIVMNHMATGSGPGVGGTDYDESTLSYPGVPYSSLDFNSKTSYPSHCPSASGGIEDYNDANQVRNCRLVGMPDLNHGKTYVQNQTAEWMNRLIDAGVAGFRFDAAKHMWPSNMNSIFKKLKTLNTDWFNPNSKPFIYQEVIDYGSEAVKSREYFYLGRVTEFSFGKYVSSAFRDESNKLKNLGKNFGEGWGYLMPEGNAVVFIDNHDNQRGHGGGGNIATFREPRLYKMVVAYMLAWNYGVPRVMSSYYWEQYFVNGQDKNDWVGPPADSNYNIKPVTINEDDTCGNGWMCEHRWRQIYNMATFRKAVGWEAVENWWDDGDNQIAFSRGSKGFFVINSSSWKSLDASLSTGLPQGRYCDVISGNISEDKNSCTGSVITVGGDGRAYFYISNKAEDPMIAIHVEAKLN